jgi:tRNA-splicing ligase RtcB
MEILEVGDGKVEIWSWCGDLEASALSQAQNLSRLPFAFHHVALMPDAHMGYGMPIGGVLATQGVVIPNAVGVDIGCGMCAVETNVFNDDVGRDNILKILSGIRETVPVGFKHHSTRQDDKWMPLEVVPDNVNHPVCARESERAAFSVGTLGGGNHFIELQKNDQGLLSVMIHSGSRNLGKQVADHYNKIAEALNERYRSAVPAEWELAFLPLDSDEGQAYMREMSYCVDFALCNRALMLERIKDALRAHTVGIEFEETVNIAHNYAKMEHHYGRDVLVHRKGATLAREGTVGIIPGSQGASSYIVRGKGNHASFDSCSHGAGRKMGRNQARKNLSLEDEQRQLEERGIIHSVRNEKDLDEAPGAYKDIDGVIRQQEDLVDVIERRTPLAVVKG